MVREAPSLQYDAKQRIAANEGGFGFLAEMHDIHAEMANMNNKIKKVESHSQSHLVCPSVRTQIPNMHSMHIIHN